jgi:hypothetical protein
LPPRLEPIILSPKSASLLGEIVAIAADPAHPEPDDSHMFFVQCPGAGGPMACLTDRDGEALTVAEASERFGWSRGALRDLWRVTFTD